MSNRDGIDARLSALLGVEARLVTERVPTDADHHRAIRDRLPGHGAVSLAYALPLAVALLGPAGSELGVDLEPVGRPVGPIDRLLRHPRDPSPELEPRLRLWTVKEAVFKAHPCSRDLTGYACPRAGRGGIALAPCGRRIRHATLRLEPGSGPRAYWLSVARTLPRVPSEMPGCHPQPPTTDPSGDQQCHFR